MTATLDTPVLRQARESRALLTARSPRNLRLVQITTDPAHAHSNIYMEAQVFTPDARRFVYRRMRIDPSNIDMRYWRQEFWLCDLEDNFALRQLTHEEHATAPAVSPDGQYLYYFINSLAPGSGAPVQLKRVHLDSLERETVMVVDRPLPGTSVVPSLIYPLSTIRSDGGALCAGVFIGNGISPGVWALLVFDIARGEARVIFEGANVFNPHPQYCRSTDPRHRHDLLVQDNLDADCDARGKLLRVGSGCLLYVLRDDGRDFRYVPCGGDAAEKCHGHQEWRGQGTTVMAGVDQPGQRPVIEATPLPAPRGSVKLPRLMPGAEAARHDISRSIDLPQFGHTAFDHSGTRFVGDWRKFSDPPETTQLYVGRLAQQPGSALELTYLLDPRSSYGRCQSTHPHPFLSPDGRRVVFNSDYTGTPQIWMAEGFETQEIG